MTCDSRAALANANRLMLIRRLECGGFALAQKTPAPLYLKADLGPMVALSVPSMIPASSSAVWMPAMPAAAAIDAAAAAEALRWSLQRRCSLAPGQLGGCLAVLVTVSGLVGLAFWWAGVPFVTAFAGLELLAVLMAFALHARHAADGECLWLQGGRLHVEIRRGARVQHLALDLWDLRVHADAEDAIGLRAGSHRLQVGRFADRRQRQRVLRDLRDAVDRARGARAE